jgi:hypothetical protein
MAARRSSMAPMVGIFMVCVTVVCVWLWCVLAALERTAAQMGRGIRVFSDDINQEIPAQKSSGTT